MIGLLDARRSQPQDARSARAGTCSTSAALIGRAPRPVARGRAAGRVDLPDARPRPPRSVRFRLATLALCRTSSGFVSPSPSDRPRRSLAFEADRRTLKEMAARHGNLVSRMAQIQDRIAAVDINLIERVCVGPGEICRREPALTAEAYEICDKLSLVQPLSWNSRVAYAITAFALADYQAEDGLSPDLELIRKAERLWEQAASREPQQPPGNGEPRGRPATARRGAGGPRPARRGGAVGAPIARHGPGQPRAALRPGHRLRPERGTHRQLPTKLSAGPAPTSGGGDSRPTPSPCSARRPPTASRTPLACTSESTFDPIRSDPDFAAILADIEFPDQPFESR